MVKRLTEINKTAVFSWSPGQQTPYIASGTAAGALDDSFSNASELELFKLDLGSSNGIHSTGKISSTAR
jgi:protein transport protein SEC31